MIEAIVSTSRAVLLVGASDIGDNDLTISLTVASTVVAADGGADHVLARGLRPVAVIGDADSLSPAAQAAFGEVLHPLADQDTTDFEKALARIDAPLIVAAGFLGGRLDHTLAVLNVMARRPDPPVVLVGAHDVVLKVPPALRVAVPAGTRVGLMPLGPARVTTTGLVWNLTNRNLAPDGAVSSSNRSADEVFTVAADGPLFLTLPQSCLHAALAALGH